MKRQPETIIMLGRHTDESAPFVALRRTPTCSVTTRLRRCGHDDMISHLLPRLTSLRPLCLFLPDQESLE